MSDGSSGTPIRIGTVIMHHPRRTERLPRLIEACGPLAPRVVADPDPDGVPSPLRTAKRAWADIEDGVTHHLVLQDDIVPVPGFAAQLRAAVAARPDHGISMYSHWDSPQNSYLVRRAAVAGTAWAPLAPAEWTPTQGFVLPVDQARRLAAYLAGIPDDVQDDDEMVVIFCRKQGVPVAATVPHLLDHGHDPTIVGHHGRLHATVLAPERPPPPGHWSMAEQLDPGPYTVELLESRCGLRIVHGEPVEHQFGWYWHDACALARVAPETILSAADPHLAALPAHLVRPGTEIWAAGFLLGADAARAGDPPPGGGPLTHAAIATWVDSGLSAADHTAAGDSGRAALTALGVTATQCGLAAAKGATTPNPPHGFVAHPHTTTGSDRPATRDRPAKGADHVA
ncbi:hypothetical protein [Spirillospora sp. CA-294931]|uniref:hypothetical protein n=1 Tax=Spirillospora sp. CA-294931 TaxID=3240042 RepID=UPI003D935234